MMVVHRFPVSTSAITVPIHHGARLLGVFAAGDGTPSLYVLHDTSKGVERRTFKIVATGEETDSGEYVCSFSPDKGFVFHLFEVER